MKTWTKSTGLIMATLAGSYLYGTSRPDSDIDIRGVCFPPHSALLGLQGFEQFQPQGGNAVTWALDQGFQWSDDVTVYALGKFFQLCVSANPNIIELLFAPDMLYQTPVWEEIVANRGLFLSTKIVHTFAGYAFAQLKRIQRHKEWLNNPPGKPNPYEFGLADKPSGAQDWTSRNQKNAYENQLKQFQHYETWRENRNPARAELERKYGYDTKHAMHLYRLAYEAEELLLSGHLTLPLRSVVRARLMDVLEGKMSYEAVVKTAKDMKERLQELEESSPLPKRPDRKRVEGLLMRLHLEWLQTK